METSITLTAKQVDDGFLVSLNTTGDYEDRTLHSKFYSYDQVPPPEVPPQGFWAKILGDVSGFLFQDL